MTHSMTRPQVILIDDDEEILEAYTQTLELAGFLVLPCASLMQAREHLSRDSDAVVLSDVKMAARDGFAVLGEVRAVDADMPVILISGHADVPMALSALRGGAFDFVEKPADPAYVIELLKRASAHRELVLSHRRLKGVVQSKAIETRIIGRSPAMVQLRNMTVALAQVDVTVLILGETGTGKELVARSLHDFGPRAKAPFVAINCAALPQSIIESELFGHEAGAFTGARERRIGKIELADKGTLFLDEIESMPMDAQVRLLRVLQERKLERIGGNKEISVDIRVIAATKTDLATLARQGNFREDLVYRLAVVPVTTPALRDRGRGDIELLFRHFHSEAAARLGKSAAAIMHLNEVLSHSWPGNVRELRNAAERAALGFSALGIAGAGTAFPQVVPADEILPATLAQAMAAHEKREIEISLSGGGLLHDIAARLGISRKTLYLKMREHGIVAPGDLPRP